MSAGARGPHVGETCSFPATRVCSRCPGGSASSCTRGTRSARTKGRGTCIARRRPTFREARERYQRPIVFDRWTHPNQNFDSHTYPKAAAVIHMLRYVLGDAEFFRALKHFLEKHAYQPVQTEGPGGDHQGVSANRFRLALSRWKIRTSAEREAGAAQARVKQRPQPRRGRWVPRRKRERRFGLLLQPPP